MADDNDDGGPIKRRRDCTVSSFAPHFNPPPSIRILQQHPYESPSPPPQEGRTATDTTSRRPVFEEPTQSQPDEYYRRLTHLQSQQASSSSTINMQNSSRSMNNSHNHQHRRRKKSKKHRKRHIPPGPAGIWYQLHCLDQAAVDHDTSTTTTGTDKNNPVRGLEDGDNDNNNDGNNNNPIRIMSQTNREAPSSSTLVDVLSQQEENSGTQTRNETITRPSSRDKNHLVEANHVDVAGSSSVTFGNDVSVAPAWKCMMLSLDIRTPYVPLTESSQRRYQMIRSSLPPSYALLPEIHAGRHDLCVTQNLVMCVMQVYCHGHCDWTVELQDECGVSITAWLEEPFVTAYPHWIRPGAVWFCQDVTMAVFSPDDPTITTTTHNNHNNHNPHHANHDNRSHIGGAANHNGISTTTAMMEDDSIVEEDPKEVKRMLLLGNDSVVFAWMPEDEAKETDQDINRLVEERKALVWNKNNNGTVQQQHNPNHPNDDNDNNDDDDEEYTTQGQRVMNVTEGTMDGIVIPEKDSSIPASCQQETIPLEPPLSLSPAVMDCVLDQTEAEPSLSTLSPRQDTHDPPDDDGHMMILSGHSAVSPNIQVHVTTTTAGNSAPMEQECMELRPMIKSVDGEDENCSTTSSSHPHDSEQEQEQHESHKENNAMHTSLQDQIMKTVDMERHPINETILLSSPSPSLPLPSCTKPIDNGTRIVVEEEHTTKSLVLKELTNNVVVVSSSLNNKKKMKPNMKAQGRSSILPRNGNHDDNNDTDHQNKDNGEKDTFVNPIDKDNNNNVDGKTTYSQKSHKSPLLEGEMERTRSSVFQPHSSGGFVLDSSVVDSILDDDDDDDDENGTNTATTNKKDESSLSTAGGRLHVGTSDSTNDDDAPCRQPLMEDNHNTKQPNVPKSLMEPMNHDATKRSLFRDASFSNMIMDDLMEDDDDDDDD